MYPLDDTVIIGIRVECVPENLMLQTLLDCVDNKVWCPEIHVRLPKVEQGSRYRSLSLEDRT